MAAKRTMIDVRAASKDVKKGVERVQQILRQASREGTPIGVRWGKNGHWMLDRKVDLPKLRAWIKKHPVGPPVLSTTH